MAERNSTVRDFARYAALCRLTDSVGTQTVRLHHMLTTTTDKRAVSFLAEQYSDDCALLDELVGAKADLAVKLGLLEVGERSKDTRSADQRQRGAMLYGRLLSAAREEKRSAINWSAVDVLPSRETQALLAREHVLKLMQFDDQQTALNMPFMVRRIARHEGLTEQQVIDLLTPRAFETYATDPQTGVRYVFMTDADGNTYVDVAEVRV